MHDGTWDTAVVSTRDWSVVDRAYQWLASGKHPFNSLTIDSISELQQKFIESRVGREQPTMQVWGETYRSVTGLIRDLRDLTVHPVKPLSSIVLTAMTRQIDGVYRPWCQGQLQAVLPYLLDVCGYLWVEQVQDPETGQTSEVRKLLTRRTNQFEAGERVDGRLPPVLEIERRESGVPGRDIVSMLDRIFPASANGQAPRQPTDSEAEPEMTQEQN